MSPERGELRNKVALVTGGARGLGAAIAEVFCREGAQVVITDVLAEEGEQLARRLGDSVRFIEHDVSVESEWTRALDYSRSEFGRLDILVNNAGVTGVYPLETTTPELWQRLLSIMETGPFLGMRCAIPAMLETGGGCIVNIASTNAIRGMARTAAYTAAKHGLLGLTRALALEYAAKGIRINAVCPGAMKTPMLKESFGDQMEDFAAHVPLGRLAEPREVAEVVAFVASERASFCVGATFVADGGMTVT
jgi:3alpha(or 20beta)-hydroxysteroid dehydrogenase